MNKMLAIIMVICLTVVLGACGDKGDMMDNKMTDKKMTDQKMTEKK
jgi:major membrane immunogen (membrane-anchored lipoprotein)